MRVLLDYRPALRDRTGVGEYVHQLAKALAQAGNDEIILFSSSWRDRLQSSDAGEVRANRTIDRRWPVRLLNLCWHRFGWPPIEQLTGESFDVVHSPHPLLLPSRGAARVITIHDLDFLINPAHVQGEIRRDYRVLAAAHAHRADRVIVSSRYTANLVQSKLGVSPGNISVCPGGVPDWSHAEHARGLAGAPGYILFVGTLEARKNVPGLLTAYAKLVARLPEAPRLVLAGKLAAGADTTLAVLKEAPLEGRVETLGYVQASRRQALYQGAALLVLPSFDEGFGLPAVEAMSLGVPVVASSRGALPEVVGDAGLLVDPADADAIAAAMATVLTDATAAARLSARGRERARRFSWARCAELTREAYALAVGARQGRRTQGTSPGGVKG